MKKKFSPKFQKKKFKKKFQKKIQKNFFQKKISKQKKIFFSIEKKTFLRFLKFYDFDNSKTMQGKTR